MSVDPILPEAEAFSYVLQHVSASFLARPWLLQTTPPPHLFMDSFGFQHAAGSPLRSRWL